MDFQFRCHGVLCSIDSGIGIISRKVHGQVNYTNRRENIEYKGLNYIDIPGADTSFSRCNIM